MTDTPHDVLVIGSGAAGLTAALALAETKKVLVLAKGRLDSGSTAWAQGGIAAVLGHVFPIYIGFRGGKGVATGAGMLVVNAPFPVACALGVFALMLFLFGRVSLGSIFAAISLPISVFLIDRFTSIDYPVLLLALAIALALFILYTHRSNIGRLLKGEEKAFPKLQLWKRILRSRR